jgi:large subunit ribosomal protein L10
VYLEVTFIGVFTVTIYCFMHLHGAFFISRGYRHKQSRSAMANKVEKVAELTGLFQNSNAVFLTEYRGLTVAQLKELRRNISADATYAVAKNTLIEIAAKNAGVNAFDGQLFGPTALAFATGDAVSVAKALRDFAKANPLLVVKSGVLDGITLSAAEVQKLADLETREVLLAKAAGMFKASMYKAAYTIQAPLSQAVRTVDALRAKQAA